MVRFLSEISLRTCFHTSFSVGLEEGGMHAKALYGKQFIKMLQLIYECLLSEEKTRIGGTDVLAQASRARCLLEIEKIMG